MNQAQFDALAAQVKDMSAAIKSGNENLNGVIRETLAGILKDHPGFVSQRKMEFPTSSVMGGSKADAIMNRMPQELQEQLDYALITAKVLKTSVSNLKMFQNWCEEGKEFKKALDTADANGGGNWVPSNFTPRLFEDIRVSQRVAGLFGVIPMTSPIYSAPVQIGRINTFKVSEQTADTGQTKIPVSDGNSLTGKAVWTAKGHGARVLFSSEVNEDSIVPILPWLRGEIVKAMADGREDMVLNGDTAGTHEDSDTAAVTDHRNKTILGLRAMANDQSYKADLSTLSLSNIRLLLRKLMGKYGINPRDLALVPSLSAYIRLVNLDEVTTLDKYGPGATVLAGELGNIDGVPVIPSEFVRENLNASGVYDGVTTTKTAIYLVFRPGFWWGMRRQMELKLLDQLYAESDQLALVIKERLDFQPVYPIASNKMVYLGYNIPN